MLQNFRKCQSLILLLHCIASPTQAQTRADLAYFLKNTKENNLNLKSQEATSEAQGYLKSRAAAGYYPSINARASRSYDLPLTEREASVPFDSALLSLNALQPLYDEKLTRTYDRDALIGKKAKATVIDASERLLQEAGKAFFTLANLQTDASLKLRQLTMQLSEDEVLQRRIQLGELNVTNGSQMQSQIQRSRANLALLGSKIREQQLILARLCVCKVPEMLQLPPESSWREDLESQNTISASLLNVAKVDIEVAQANLRLTQSKSKPTLRFDSRMYGDIASESKGVRSSLALNFAWPLDVAHSTQYETAQASSQLQSARLNLTALQNELQANQEIARERLRTLIDSRHFFESALVSAQKHFENTKRLFAEGDNTQTELFLAQTNLFQAESDLLKHTFDSWLSFWDLSFYRNSLTRMLRDPGKADDKDSLRDRGN